MTDREKAIVMAHTGICMLKGDKFQIFHKYVEDIMGSSIMTHEIGFLEDEIKEKSKTDFIMLCANEEQEPCVDAISRAEAMSHPFANGKYDHKNANEDFILGFESYKEWLETLPPVYPKAKEQKWIPVSEGLPQQFRFVNCTCHSLIDDREDWVIDTVYIPQLSNSPYSDWGNIPMLNWKQAEVVAWMYRDIPEPYKAESEDKE